MRPETRRYAHDRCSACGGCGHVASVDGQVDPKIVDKILAGPKKKRTAKAKAKRK